MSPYILNDIKSKLMFKLIFVVLTLNAFISISTTIYAGDTNIIPRVVKHYPAILYTDLIEGPSGSFVTVWGHNIPVKSTFTCGNEPCQIVRPLEHDKNHPAHGIIANLQKIVVKFNSGSGITMDDYNTLPFTLNNGRIYKITPADSIGRILDKMNPGDVLYLRKGVYKTKDPDSWRPGSIIWATNSRDELAVVGYPGERVVLDLSNGGLSGFDTIGDIHNWTIANMECVGTGNVTTSGNNGRCIQASRKGSRTNLRVVNMYNHGTGRNAGGAFGVFSNTRGLYVLGNFSENTGTSSGKTHSIYHGGRGKNDNINFEFNRVGRHVGRRGIQIFGHSSDETMTNLRIRYNHIHDQGSNGILVSHTDGLSGDPQTRCWISDALVEGNTVEKTDITAIRFLGCDADPSGNKDFIARNNFVEGKIVADFPTGVLFEGNCALGYSGSYIDGGNNLTGYPSCH